MICMHLYDICARMIDEEVRAFKKGAYEVYICTCMACICTYMIYIHQY